MALKPQKITITAALPYANGPIHIGHLAGVYLPADVYARHMRSIGHDVAFLSGSDEHGVPISILAKQQGKSPQQIIEKYHYLIKNSLLDFDISFDYYTRTSDSEHKKYAQDFFLKLQKQGILEKKSSEQLYDPEVKTFLADRYVEGTCPKCLQAGAYGDQCEKCGNSLSPLELINPISKLSATPPQKKQTEHWYLPLEKFRFFLKTWILAQKNSWKSTVYQQVLSWLESPLPSRAITRDLSWGIPVPLDGSKGKVLYVWFEAPLAYLTACQLWAKEKNKNWEDYWKKEDAHIIHFIGKDNIIFHSIIFPSMLKAHGGYRLPKNIPANEFMNLEGRKISTSKRWAVWLHEYLKEIPNHQDSLRYTLLCGMPETKDSDFTWKDFQTKHNSELVGILGNFINRVCILCEKYFDSEIPSNLESTPEDDQVLNALNQFSKKIDAHLTAFQFRSAIQECMSIARLGNKYLADQAPWKKNQNQPKRTASILYTSAQICGYLSICLDPFLPRTASKIRKIFGIQHKRNDRNLQLPLLPEGRKILKDGLLFEKIEDILIEKQMEKLEKMSALTPQNVADKNSSKPEKKANISFEDFEKLDLRSGIILEASKVEKTDKLLKFLVDLGDEKRVIVSGLAQHFSHEEMVGKKVCVVVNLAPRKIRGVLSQGMILTTESRLYGNLNLLEPKGEPGDLIG